MKSEDYSEEQRIVIESFRKGFRQKKNENIVLYGIGKNTDAILRACSDYNIVALMDQNTEGQIIYDLPVLPMNNVKSIDNPVVVIVARQSVVDIIYKRIESLWIDDEIGIFDFEGNDLTKKNSSYSNTNLEYWNYSYSDLCNAIDCHDVISFDIFDTLLMRKVLLPKDIFELVRIELKNYFEEDARKCDKKASAEPDSDVLQLIIDNYVDYRILAEKKAGYCCDYEKIYRCFENICIENVPNSKQGLIQKWVGNIKNVEWQYEERMLRARIVLVDALNYAVAKEKEVYILSDMYYSSVFLKKILSSNGVAGYKDVFVSCEIGCQKEDGTAYSWYLRKINRLNKPNSCLHIGDNRRVDGEMAKKNGMDSFLIYSAYEMLSASSMQGMLADTSSIYVRGMLGLIAYNLFENPFALYEKKGYVTVNDVDILGYNFIGPFMTLVALWIEGKLKERNIGNLLLPSRDGYLISKLFDIINTGDIKTTYFRTSRRAVSVASIRNRDDITKIANRKFSGTYKEFMRRRYGVEIAEECAEELVDDNNIGYLITKYENEIFCNAANERKQYIEYLNELDIKSENSLLFDFVAGGTVQYNLSNLLEEDFDGIYVATMNLPNSMYTLEDDRIISMFGNISSYGSNSNLAKYYLFLETVLIDDKMSFSHINEQGDEVFEKSTSEPDYAGLALLQDNILEFAREYVTIYGRDGLADREMAFVDELLGVLFSEKVKVSDSVKEIFTNDDVYDGVEKYRTWK